MNDKGDYFSGDLFFLPAHCMLNFADGVGWILHMSPISVHNTSPCRLLYPPYTHTCSTHPHTHMHTHLPPPNPASCMACAPPLSPSCICCSPVLYFPLDDKMNLHIFPRERSLECINRPPPSLTSRL